MIRLNMGNKEDLEVMWTKDDPAGQNKAKKYESVANKEARHVGGSLLSS